MLIMCVTLPTTLNMMAISNRTELLKCTAEGKGSPNSLPKSTMEKKLPLIIMAAVPERIAMRIPHPIRAVGRSHASRRRVS